MDMYSTACKEALTAKQKVVFFIIHRFSPKVELVYKHGIVSRQWNFNVGR